MHFDSPIVHETTAPKFSPFAELAEKYADFRPDPPRQGAKIIKELLPADAKIVDLGCGTGKATRQLCDEGFTHVTGLDLEPIMLAHAMAQDVAHRITYIQGDVSAKNGLPFENDSVDAFTAYSALHWFSGDQGLTNILQALKPGGYFFVVRGGLKSDNPVKTDDPSEAIRRATSEVIIETLKIPKEAFKVGDKKALKVCDLIKKGFKFVQEGVIRDEQQLKYTVEDYIKYLSTFSEWNKVNEASL